MSWKKKYAKRVEVIGFSKDQIYAYIDAYPFPTDPVNMVSKLKSFLNQHPNVLHMCYLPVHAAIICFLFSQMEGNLPHIETKIYEKFIIATLLRTQGTHSKTTPTKILERFVRRRESNTYLIQFCKLAFDMIINSQQVVSKSDSQVSLCDGSGLGLLTVESTLKSTAVKISIPFII